MNERMITYAYAREKGLFDLGPIGDEWQVCFRENGALPALAELRRVIGKPLRIEVLDETLFQKRLTEAFNTPGQRAASMVGDIEDSDDLTRLLEEMPDIEDLLDSEEEAPIIRLINTLMTEALREGASDIHIELFEQRSLVRFRVDGQLRDIIEPKRALHAAIVSRVKVMAGLDIAERRLPQDGRIALRAAGKPIDVRVSTIPTGHGERVVLRLLDKQAGRLDPFACLRGAGKDRFQFEITLDPVPEFERLEIGDRVRTGSAADRLLVDKPHAFKMFEPLDRLKLPHRE